MPLRGQPASLRRLGKRGKWTQNIERDLHRKVGVHVSLLHLLRCIAYYIKYAVHAAR